MWGGAQASAEVLGLGFAVGTSRCGTYLVPTTTSSWVQRVQLSWVQLSECYFSGADIRRLCQGAVILPADTYSLP